MYVCNQLYFYAKILSAKYTYVVRVFFCFMRIREPSKLNINKHCNWKWACFPGSWRCDIVPRFNWNCYKLVCTCVLPWVCARVLNLHCLEASHTNNKLKELKWSWKYLYIYEKVDDFTFIKKKIIYKTVLQINLLLVELDGQRCLLQ